MKGEFCMFEKLKSKAAKPLTHGWLWNNGAINIIAVGIIYGGLWAYGCYLEKQDNDAEAAEKANHNEFEED
jgi:hypothetical protein